MVEKTLSDSVSGAVEGYLYYAERRHFPHSPQDGEGGPRCLNSSWGSRHIAKRPRATSSASNKRVRNDRKAATDQVPCEATNGIVAGGRGNDRGFRREHGDRYRGLVAAGQAVEHYEMACATASSTAWAGQPRPQAESRSLAERKSARGNEGGAALDANRGQQGRQRQLPLKSRPPTGRYRGASPPALTYLGRHTAAAEFGVAGVGQTSLRCMRE